MMQDRAVSEKHVAGGSALPGERDLTLIVADEGWLHSKALRHQAAFQPRKDARHMMRFSWTEKCPVILEKIPKYELNTESNKLHNTQSMNRDVFIEDQPESSNLKNMLWYDLLAWQW